MPGRAEPLAQRGELTGYWAIGGDRVRLCEHRDDLFRHGALDRSPGVSAGQNTLGLQHEQALTEPDRYGFGRQRRGPAAGRYRRPEREPDEAGPVADQIKPPDIARGHG